ncbi:interleukin 1 receptor associated kinase 4 tube [Megachile rotundata]|uniref:interleukin 1 receptor associated kinase 4 tube n=1 Tax=Megachile rotundata TaxID=143995 RepID=UPI003FD4F473
MSQNTICWDTELRKLKLGELYQLGWILNVSDLWKKLMAIVPKEDTSDLPKFTSEHFSIIEQAAQQQKRNAAEIFLSEWGTMGKRRPTLHTLFKLLVKAELFRAADYVARDILKVELPERPKCGPAAPVDTSDEIMKELLKKVEEFQKVKHDEICAFQLPSKINENENINCNAIDKCTNDSFVDRNIQSTKLVSTKEKCDVKTSESCKDINARQDPIEILSNKETYNSLSRVYITDANTLPQLVFENAEMMSDKLPKPVLNKFRQTAEETILYEEMLPDELPTFLNDRINLSPSVFGSSETNNVLHLSNLNINEYELISNELPQCIVEFQRNSTANVDNTVYIENSEDKQENVLSSQQLPITVLEYNK